MTNALHAASAVARETKEILDRRERVPEGLVVEAQVAHAWGLGKLPGTTARALLEEIDAAARLAPGDERVGCQLVEFVEERATDVAQMRALIERVLRGWKGTQYAEPSARAARKRLDRIGKPYPIGGPDIQTGRTVRDEELRGTPVLLHVFAVGQDGTRQEVATLGKMREELADRVRIISVQGWRHRGGADDLRKKLE